MDFHGHINLQENLMQSMVVGSESDFPSSPVLGRIVFKNFTLYMCVALNGILPIWIPLTNTINTHKHTQSVASTSWNVTHSLSTLTPMVQVYDNANQLIIPNAITILDELSLVVTVNSSITGKVITMKGDEIPVNGIGVLSPDPVAYDTDFVSLATIVVNHNLGYYPVTRIFVGGTEIQASNIVHDSIFQTTVTLASSQSGTIRLT